MLMKYEYQEESCPGKLTGIHSLINLMMQDKTKNDNNDHLAFPQNSMDI